jgi:hypothetical protein
MNLPRFLFALCSIYLGSAVAQAGQPGTVSDDELRAELQRAHARIDELESRLGMADELDARRSEEIRALVADVLADVDTRAALAGNGLTAGHDGKAFLASSDGLFRLSIWGFTQTRYTANYRKSEPGVDRWRHGFSVQRTRLFLDGKVHDATFRVRGTFGDTGSISLDQAYIQLPVFGEYRMRIGQFALPLFHDDWVAAQSQLAVNQSVVNTVFGQGQSQGIWLHGAWETTRFWISFNDGAQTGNTSALSGNNADAAVTGRFEFRFGEGGWDRFDDYTSFPGEPFGGFVGLAAHFETGSDLPQNTGDKLGYFTAGLGLEGDGWNVYGLGVLAYNDFDTGDDEYVNDYGLLVQGGFFISPVVELFSRFDWVEGGSERDNSDPFRSLTAGFNWYIIPDSHRLKFTSNVIYFFDPTEGTIVNPSSAVGLLPSTRSGQVAVQMQLQLIF